jgi:hypothetical protein
VTHNQKANGPGSLQNTDEKMLLYRGIAVSHQQVADTVSHVRQNGLLPGQGSWRYLFADLKPQLESLLQLPNLSTVHTKPTGEAPPRVGACADRTGAAYYALSHNRSIQNDTPLLITFEADVKDVIIDGRDFLYTLFQFGKPDHARSVAEQLFGAAILRYVDRAWSTEDQHRRIALCDLAVQDEAVIRAHAKNKTVIGGRYGTRFCNAFLVRLPISPEAVHDIRRLEPEELPAPKINLDMIR